MDPSALMNEGSFPNANAAPYSLAEIWPFQMNGGGEAGVGLGLRRPHFGHNLAPSGDVSGANREVSANDPMSLDQRGSHGVGNGSRKRPYVEDDSAKGVSTSSGNGNGNGNGNGLVFPSFFFIKFQFVLP